MVNVNLVTPELMARCEKWLNIPISMQTVHLAQAELRNREWGLCDVLYPSGVTDEMLFDVMFLRAFIRAVEKEIEEMRHRSWRAGQIMRGL